MKKKDICKLQVFQNEHIITTFTPRAPRMVEELETIIIFQ